VAMRTRPACAIHSWISNAVYVSPDSVPTSIWRAKRTPKDGPVRYAMPLNSVTASSMATTFSTGVLA
jgi:hypothetical protein